MKKGRFWWLALAAVVAIGALFVFLIAGLLASALPRQDCVGVIHVDGEIVTGSMEGSLFSAGGAGSDDIVPLIEDAAARKEVKAMLVEINSPGGSVVGTREIYDALLDVDKPKVSYFREMAASGGYYIAAGTDYIVSDPAALTGSIGVRMTAVDMSALFGKLGYNETEIKSGDMKDMGSPARPLTDSERAVLQSIVNESFVDFKTAVERGRAGKLDEAKFSEILDARVLTGKQAKAIGLVDETGNRKLALQKAASLGGIRYSGDAPPVCEIKAQRSLLGGLLSSSADFTAGVVVRVLQSGGMGGLRLSS